MTDVDHAVTVASLLRDPERARVYTGLFVDGPVSAEELADRIDGVDTDRVREILAGMSDAGFVTETDDGYDGESLNAQIGGVEITSVIVAVVSASAIRSDLRGLRDEYGVDGIIRSVSAVEEYLRDRSTWRMAVEDTPATESEMWAIEDVVMKVRE